MNGTGFAGRTAVVTGASGEIGASIGSALADRGANVWGLDVRAENGRPTRIGGGTHRTVRLDVTDSSAVDSVLAEVEQTTGSVDLLVNCAGGPGRVRTGLDQVTDEQWHAVTALNLDATFYCCRGTVAAMRRSGGGSIVNISSGAGRTHSRTGVQAYAAAKAGVIGLTRQLAHELGGAGIRVNCVAPGFVFTEPTRGEWARLPDADKDALRANTALGRVGVADDLVGPVLFFLSDAAKFVTGQTISVDGGSVMLG